MLGQTRQGVWLLEQHLAAVLDRIGAPRRPGSTVYSRALLAARDPSLPAPHALELAWALNDVGYILAEADVAPLRHTGLQLTEAAVRLAPLMPPIMDSVGWAHYRCGDLADAIFWLQKAWRHYGGHWIPPSHSPPWTSLPGAALVAAYEPDIPYHLGVVCIAAGRDSEGEKMLRIALRLDRGHRAAHQALQELRQGKWQLPLPTRV